ncbi:hypothetical protein KC19_2G009500 [Ceratodon purpureus]|uniref:Secreted protein n=1 Tax=Ceratodon purpureus TaxID=3225 RepID=A0A8T0IQW9_CERPU|nr:hypothetical protein KC19_2G009500 [Ceratodon purpureus]
MLHWSSVLLAIVFIRQWEIVDGCLLCLSFSHDFYFTDLWCVQSPPQSIRTFSLPLLRSCALFPFSICT